MASAFKKYCIRTSTSFCIKRYYNQQQTNSHRYNGYINKLIEDKRIGHAVRNDQPEKEYFFTYNDIIVDKEIVGTFRSEISVKILNLL